MASATDPPGSTDSPDLDVDPIDVDPIDEEAAEIDARSPIAAEQIEELKEHAEDEGRAVEP